MDGNVNQIYMTVKSTMGSMWRAAVFGARTSFRIAQFFYRLAQKNKIPHGRADDFLKFMQESENKYTIYNVPLTTEESQRILPQIESMRAAWQAASTPREKKALEESMKYLWGSLPEIRELEATGIHFSVLPKLGSGDSFQVAVDKKFDQEFSHWFLERLRKIMSGGEHDVGELKLFTEGNYSLFNLPLENEALDAAKEDWTKMGINFAVLRDLKIGDGQTQIAVANADVQALELWFKGYRNQCINHEKQDPGEIRKTSLDEYAATAKMTEEEVIRQSAPEYQQVDKEFKENEFPAPWADTAVSTTDPEIEQYLDTDLYEPVSINLRSLADEPDMPEIAADMKEQGLFLSRVPGTWGRSSEFLVVPNDRVFQHANGNTAVLFLPKNEACTVLLLDGHVKEKKPEEITAHYKKVEIGKEFAANLQKELRPPAAALTAKPVPVIEAPAVPKL